MGRLNTLAAACLFASVTAGPCTGQTAPAEDGRVLRDLRYKQAGDVRLEVDLYLPPTTQPAPVVVWIHGGGWRGGSKDRCPLAWLTQHGYAVASISYRLSDQAIFPAQIQDCRSALRALRDKARKYGLDPSRMAVAGSSAGGHLAALLGTSAGVSELDDPQDDTAVSDRVQAVIDFYGPTDLVAFREGRPGQEGSPESLLLGGTPAQKPQLARAASPVTHVDVDDPPFFIIHGTDDRTVPVDQSRRLARALEQHGVAVELDLVEGMGHSSGPWLAQPANRQRLVDFLDRHLRRR